jgi:prevent-host-death family protein
MTMVNIHMAKTKLSELLLRVEAGEEIIIARNGNPIAKLTKLDSDHTQRPGPGIDAGKIIIAADFDDSLPEFDLI